MLCFRGFAFLIVDVTFHGLWQIFGVRCRPLCGGGFVCLGSNRSLAKCADGTVQVVLARSHNCPPKLRPDLYTKGDYVNITTLGQLPATMVSNGPKYRWGSAKKWSCNVVDSDRFPEGSPALCCLCGFVFLIVDLTFHEQWHILRVRRQPLCSGSFVCLATNRSLAKCADGTVQVVLARSHNCPPKLRPDLYTKGDYVNITTLGQLPATMVSKGPK